ncbi:MAG TPA: dihydroorotate dehydrogenase electron transfer subunit, partial [Clostridia bacterium]|nr:dihydroorotate dehydrogenase electron transfer subunit [Clostridia bacterium]
MTKGLYKISHNKKIAKDIYEMRVMGDTSSLSRPGQFINILLSGFYLRRPISVCDYDGNSITIIYKIVGEGTEYL